MHKIGMASLRSEDGHNLHSKQVVWEHVMVSANAEFLMKLSLSY